MPRAHAIISTHTTRHLRRTLLAVIAQTRPADSVTVTCDTDAPDIGDLVARIAAGRAVPITLVQRPFQGDSRSSQVRNNGVRALLTQPRDPTDVLWFLDGDCLPAPDCLEQHLMCSMAASRGAASRSPATPGNASSFSSRSSPAPGGGGGRVSEAGGGPSSRPRLVVAFRIDLTPEQTDALDESAISRGIPITPSPEQFAALNDRHRRYQRHALMRRLGLGKPHKPKLLSANFSVGLGEYLAVNGFDEGYVGYGQEDDDLGRRLYQHGVRPAIGVAHALAFHQWHETRAPKAWEESPNAARFARPFTTRCRHGVEDPLPQPEPVIHRFDVPATQRGRAV